MLPVCAKSEQMPNYTTEADPVRQLYELDLPRQTRMSPLKTLRAAVNGPRASAGAVVATLSAIGGAIAGGVAALIAAAVLTPAEPVSAGQIAAMAIGAGLEACIAGAVLGTVMAFGALRRVPLGRLVLYTNLGLAAGLTVGWLGGPWAWHHMSLLGFLGFTGGAVAAGLITRRSERGVHQPRKGTMAL